MVAAVVLAFAQPTLGGVVRVTGSGDGCPDWPQCHGAWTPPWSDYHAIVEWSHRTVGALFGLVIFAATALVWLRYRGRKPLVYTYTAALLLVAAVGGVGGGVVLSDLDPAIRTLHLAGAEVVAALTVFGLVLATYRGAYPGSWQLAPGYRPGMRLASIAAALSLITLLSGAYAVWRGAGAVCPQWPLCGGPLVPQSELVWVHVIHRLIALASIFVILYAAHRVYRLPGASGALKIAAFAAPVIIVAQALMGAANPWSHFEEWARAGHLSLATLMWVDMMFVVSLILLPVRRTAEESAPGPEPAGMETGAD
jgi:heme A synthase